ncbi:MAG: hypothetical protein ACRDLS_16900 [Solirubrobacteraceae bacterium]
MAVKRDGMGKAPLAAAGTNSAPSLGNECSEISVAVMCQQRCAPAGLTPRTIQARTGSSLRASAR